MSTAGRRYPENPIVGVGAVVLKEGSVLLIKRGKAPLPGRWSLPGGRVKPLENLREALHREVMEECSIEIDILDLITIYEYIERDAGERVKYHYIVFDFCALYRGGVLLPSSDAIDASWVSPGELQRYGLTEAALEAVHKGLEMAGF